MYNDFATCQHCLWTQLNNAKLKWALKEKVNGIKASLYLKGRMDRQVSCTDHFLAGLDQLFNATRYSPQSGIVR